MYIVIPLAIMLIAYLLTLWRNYLFTKNYLIRHYENKGYQFVSLSIDSSANAQKPFLEEKQNFNSTDSSEIMSAKAKFQYFLVEYINDEGVSMHSYVRLRSTFWGKKTVLLSHEL